MHTLVKLPPQSRTLIYLSCLKIPLCPFDVVRKLNMRFFLLRKFFKEIVLYLIYLFIYLFIFVFCSFKSFP